MSRRPDNLQTNALICNNTHSSESMSDLLAEPKQMTSELSFSARNGTQRRSRWMLARYTRGTFRACGLRLTRRRDDREAANQSDSGGGHEEEGN